MGNRLAPSYPALSPTLFAARADWQVPHRGRPQGSPPHHCSSPALTRRTRSIGRFHRHSKDGGRGDAGWRPLWSPSVGVRIRSLSPQWVRERDPTLGRDQSDPLRPMVDLSYCSICIQTQRLAYRGAQSHTSHRPQCKYTDGNERQKYQPKRKWQNNLRRDNLLNRVELIITNTA